jgi:beta-xylosidase
MTDWLLVIQIESDEEKIKQLEQMLHSRFWLTRIDLLPPFRHEQDRYLAHYVTADWHKEAVWIFLKEQEMRQTISTVKMVEIDDASSSSHVQKKEEPHSPGYDVYLAQVGKKRVSLSWMKTLIGREEVEITLKVLDELIENRENCMFGNSLLAS